MQSDGVQQGEAVASCGEAGASTAESGDDAERLGALLGVSIERDIELRTVVSAWPTLPSAIRTAIAALARIDPKEGT